MAKLRMTYKNLKALRKTREYQALLVDLVAINIVPKSAAENLLGYNIPANLIGGEESTTEDPVVTPDNGEGSGVTVTLIYVDGAGEYHTEELVLATNVLADEAANIIAAAKTAFTDDTINELLVMEQNGTEYVKVEPQPTELTNGALIACYYPDPQH